MENKKETKELFEKMAKNQNFCQNSDNVNIFIIIIVTLFFTP